MNGKKTIKIHGALSHIFGNEFKLFIKNLDYLINALDTLKSGFRKEMKRLYSNGQSYAIVSDDLDKNIIHLMPIIVGHSKVVAIVAMVVVIVIGVVLTILFPPAGVLFQIGVAMIMTGISVLAQIGAMTSPKPPDPTQQYQSIAGSSSSSGTEEKSYIFNNELNTMTQGSLVGIGYGKAKISSKIISASVKSFNPSATFLTQSELDQLTPQFYEYLAN